MRAPTVLLSSDVFLRLFFYTYILYGFDYIFIFLYFKVKTLFKHCLVILKLFIDFIFNDYLIFWPMIYHNILTIFLLLDVLVVINVFLNKTFLYLKLVSLGVGNQKNVGESYEHKTNKKKTCYLLPDCFSERLLRFVLLPSNNV